MSCRPNPFHPYRILLAAVACATLTGCLGAPIARQVASSIAMNAADTAVGKAMNEPPFGVPQTTKTNQLLVHGMDPDQLAFARAQFITMPAPPPPAAPPPPKPPSWQNAVAEVARIEAVEVWSLIIGTEKQSLLENLRQLGLANLPPEKEWEQWQVAEGGVPEQKETHMLFLIPPELGKLKSGDRAVVEVENSGLNIARDRLDP